MRTFCFVPVVCLALACDDAAVDSSDSGDAAVDSPDSDDVAVDSPDSDDVAVDSPDSDDVAVDSPDSNDAAVDSDDVAVDSNDAAVEVADPCTPNPCTTVPEATCSFDRQSASIPTDPTGEGVCTAVDGAATCAYPADTENCDAESFCSLGACLYVGSICDYPLDGPWSYTAAFAVAEPDETDPATGQPDDCCFDLDGDGTLDNGYGTANGVIESFFGIRLNDFLASQIESLTSNAVSQLRGLPADAPADAPASLSGRFDLLGFSATEVDGTTYPLAAAGDGTFQVQEHAFLENTSMPRTHVELVVDDGVIVSGQGAYGVHSGIGNRNIDMEVRAVRGTLTLDPAGRGFAVDGPGGRGVELGMVMRQSEWLAVWNGHAREFCTCTTFPDDAAFDVANLTCNTPLETRCEETDGVCKVLTDPLMCHLLIDLMPPDLDLDGDGTLDAISGGFRMKIVPTRVKSTVAGCASP